MPDFDIGPWNKLLDHRPDPDLTKYRIQDLDSAHGKLNLDYYSVHIDKLPTVDSKTFQDGKEFLKYVREHIDDFTGDLANFEPYDEKQDGEKWRSDNPKGANIHIDLGKGFRNLDDGAVVVSDVTDHSWTFTTIDTPLDLSGADWEHPVSGNREFGINERADGTYDFYTRGADRPTGFIDWLLQGHIFDKADELWRNVFRNLADFINKHGGKAEVGEREVHHIPWSEVAGPRRRKPVFGGGRFGGRGASGSWDIPDPFFNLPEPHFPEPHFPEPHFPEPHDFPEPHFPEPHDFPEPHIPEPRDRPEPPSPPEPPGPDLNNLFV